MREWLSAAVLLALAGAALAVAPSRPSSPAVQHRLVLSEEFNGSRVDTGRWGLCHWWATQGCTIASNHELQWYLPQQVRLRGGALRLVAARRDVAAPDGRRYPYASGMVSSGPRPGSTRPLFAFRYGRAAIRARVPAGKGLWSAFWLLPADRESKPEIDVMEVLGHAPQTVEMHLHGRRAHGTEWRGPDLSRGWHTYAIDWRPGRLAWLVDGAVRWVQRGPDVPSEPMYLVLNLAVGGDWPGEPSEDTRFPSELAVDYVRVWK